MGFVFNFVKRLVKLTIKLSLYFAVFAAVIVLIPNLPPYKTFSSIQLAPTLPREGPLAPNQLLNNVEQKYKGKLVGPEAFQIHNGELYTSVASGEIVKISPGGHLTFVTKIGQPCSGFTQEHICGRPLGFQFDDQGKNMYIVDSYYGIWKVDLKTDKKQLLVSPSVEIEKRTPKLLNSIALGKNGDFYWTDSTSDFHLKDGAYATLVDPSGRLFHYNAAKNESKVLLDDLWCANGLVVSPNNDFIVVAESFKYRLLKYYLTGPKKGKMEVFIEGLPGTPDNVRALPDGSGVLVGLYTVFDEQHPMVARPMAAAPAVRKFLARLQRLIELPFEYLNNVYPHIIFEEIVYYIGHFKSFSPFMPPLSGILQIDWDGNVVAGYYNTDNSVGHISDAIVYNDKLYTGSAHVQDFIGAVPAPPLLKKAFESSKKAESPKIETKPQQPKPTTQPKLETKPVEQPKVVPKPVEQPKVVPKPVEQPKVVPKPVEEPKVVPKPQQAKPVEQPKAVPKPQQPKPVEPKPKVEEKPKVQPKVETKPKVEEKKEAPKVAKPVETKPAQQPKPAEAAKPTPKPTQAPVTTPPPKPAPAKADDPKKAAATPQAAPKLTTPTPEVKTTPPPKSTEKATTPPPKPTTQMPKETKNKQSPPKPAAAKPKPEQIPIKEEIPSDTVKPNEEKLKVIKKAGPTEIPLPK